MLIKQMILSNSYYKLFCETGRIEFFLASQAAKNGVDMSLPPVEKENVNQI